MRRNFEEMICKNLILITASMVMAALLWAFCQKVSAADYPTAGITKALAQMAADSLKMDVEENEVDVVSGYEFVDDTNYDITEDDIDLLARLITAEEGYATDFEIGSEVYNNVLENYYLCGSVVMNRVNSDEFPNNLRDVIYQSGQYAVVPSGAINRPYDDIAWEVAEEVLTYGTEIPENVLGQAQFVQMDGVYRQVGNQIYSYKD